MKLKKGDRFGLPFKKQLKIYATCLNYSDEPQEVQHKIINLCYQCGGEHHEALFKAVTTEDRVIDVAAEYYIHETWLIRLIKRFYQCW